jgi:hypothetical protein
MCILSASVLPERIYLEVVGRLTPSKHRNLRNPQNTLARTSRYRNLDLTHFDFKTLNLDTSTWTYQPQNLDLDTSTLKVRLTKYLSIFLLQGAYLAFCPLVSQIGFAANWTSALAKGTYCKVSFLILSKCECVYNLEKGRGFSLYEKVPLY